MEIKIKDKDFTLDRKLKRGDRSQKICSCISLYEIFEEIESQTKSTFVFDIWDKTFTITETNSYA